MELNAVTLVGYDVYIYSNVCKGTKHVMTRCVYITTFLLSYFGMFWFSIFTARRLAKRGICRRRVSVCLSVSLCVCLCVCPSHSGIVSKRLNVGSRK